jgi:hypothetical protein
MEKDRLILITRCKYNVFCVNACNRIRAHEKARTQAGYFFDIAIKNLVAGIGFEPMTFRLSDERCAG